ncbi:hypothetical protein [Nocardioides sp.]|uniref:hypothetical protein n=1 Tax=Nocardioides sp. TaxID=35761 RepID=UPI0037837754
MRWVLGAAGVLLVLYGGWLLVSREDDLLGVAVWLAAGVLLHDAVLAGVTIVLGALAVRLAPEPARAPLVVGLVVLGTATLLAVPVLGRFGARADNPTLLDRDYTAGWLVLAALTAVAVVGAALVRSRRR